MSSVLISAKSSTCPALFIKNKNTNVFTSLYPAAAKSIVNNCYMDNFLYSCEAEEKARSHGKQIVQINLKSKWEMRSWSSNVATIKIGVGSNDKLDEIYLYVK